ncbi:unnamed protein product, partial [Choristocarpus tenellus]
MFPWSSTKDMVNRNVTGRIGLETRKKCQQSPQHHGGGEFRMLVLVGIPGSGKSSVASFLADLGWSVVNQDKLGSRKACERAARLALSRGERVVVDRCNFDDPQRAIWVRLSSEAGLGRDACLSLWLDTDPDLCKSRVRNRSGHPTLSGGHDTEAVVSRFSSLLTPPKEREGFKVVVRVRTDSDLAGAISLLLDPGGSVQWQDRKGQGSIHLGSSVRPVPVPFQPLACSPMNQNVNQRDGGGGGESGSSSSSSSSSSSEDRTTLVPRKSTSCGGSGIKGGLQQSIPLLTPVGEKRVERIESFSPPNVLMASASQTSRGLRNDKTKGGRHWHEQQQQVRVAEQLGGVEDGHTHGVEGCKKEATSDIQTEQSCVRRWRNTAGISNNRDGCQGGGGGVSRSSLVKGLEGGISNGAIGGSKLESESDDDVNFWRTGEEGYSFESNQDAEEGLSEGEAFVVLDDMFGGLLSTDKLSELFLRSGGNLEEAVQLASQACSDVWGDADVDVAFPPCSSDNPAWAPECFEDDEEDHVEGGSEYDLFVGYCQEAEGVDGANSRDERTGSRLGEDDEVDEAALSLDQLDSLSQLSLAFEGVGKGQLAAVLAATEYDPGLAAQVLMESLFPSGEGGEIG